MRRVFSLTAAASITAAVSLAAGQAQAAAFTYQTPPISASYHNGMSSEATSVKTDSQGNMYASVTSKGENGKIIKYAPNGQTVWTLDFDPGTTRPADKSLYVTSKGVSAVTVDREDNVYVVGESYNGASLDCLLKKYNTDGTLIWQTRYSEPMSGTNGSDLYCHDVTVDKAGDIIAVGVSLSFSNGQGGNYGNQIIKWNANGALIGKFNPAINGAEACGAALPCRVQIARVVTDLDQNIYTLEESTTYGNNRYAKYSPDLKLLKATQFFNPSGAPAFRPSGLAVDTQGHVFGTGAERGTAPDGTTTDFTKLVVMDKNLVQLCEDKRLFAVSMSNHLIGDYLNTVVVGPDEKAYLAGSENHDFLILPYDAQCQPQWKDAAGAPAPLRVNVDYWDLASAVTLDNGNNLIIAGQYMKPDIMTLDAAIAKFNRIVTPTSSDLTIAALFAQSTGKTGQSVMAPGYLRNNGSGPTGDPHWFATYLSTDSNITRQDILLCRGPIIAQGGNDTQPFECVGTPPANLPTGSYHIGVITDDGNVIAETDETNNTRSEPFQYTALSDLVALSVSAPASSKTGLPITVTGTVKNQGVGAALTGSTAGIYISTDSTLTSSDTLLCTAAVNPLAIGATQTVSCTGTIPANMYAGNYYAGVLADSANTIEETNEGNNGSSQAITLSAPSDLVIQTATSPASAQRGQSINISGTVRNQGFGPTGSQYSGYYFVQVFLSQDNVITTADTVLCGAGFATTQPNTTLPFNCTATLSSTLAPGTYSIGFVADQGNYVAESDETNNIKVNSIVITQ